MMSICEKKNRQKYRLFMQIYMPIDTAEEQTSQVRHFESMGIYVFS